MYKKFIEKWYENKELLREEISKLTIDELNYGRYKLLMELIIKNIYNHNTTKYGEDIVVDDIQEIDYGDYQGTLIFVYHKNIYQPSAYQTYYTIIYYGSCSGCDTLLGIAEECCDYSDSINGKLTINGVAGIMELCLYMIQETRPFKELA